MKKICLLVIVLSALLSCNSKSSSQDTSQLPASYPLEMGNFETLEKMYMNQNDILYVVNFWATWCKPCIEELPYFMAIQKKYANNPHFKLILVSLDNASAFETQLSQFIKQRNIAAHVYLLDDNKRMNQWIPTVNKVWTGAIPATAFYKNLHQVDFKEQQLTAQELETIINNHLKQ